MLRLRTLLSVVLLLLGMGSAQAQRATPADSALGLAPAVRTGELDNGLDFFIRQNDRPENRAVMRLVVDVGSIEERPNEKGLAHFVEHMLFNGTEQFEKQELVSFLESTGMEFGPDVNASTSFDETVYKLRVPTDSTAIVETAFDVLEQWAGHATLAADEIDKERGVIVEEWRAREQNAGGRMQKETLPKLLYNSRYADRLPIGDTTVVKSASPETVRGFYERWYRPNLMGVVVVGDLDPARVEQEIRERFADMTNPANPAPRSSYDVPQHEETQYAIATDPEFPVSLVSVAYKTDDQTLATVGDFRRSLVTQMFVGTLNERLSEKSRTGDTTFLRAQAFSGGLVRPARIFGLQAQVPEDSVIAGFEDVLREAERMRQHGITEAELVRRKREIEQSYEQAYTDRENQNSSRLAQEYVQHVLTGDAAPGIEVQYALVQDLLPQITVDEVSRRASTIFRPQGRVVTVQMPEKEGLTPPTERELAAALEQVRQMDVAPYEEAVSDLPLVPNKPSPGSVAETNTIDTLGVTEWTLENGVRVVVKPTDFEEDEVRFTASSPGGLSQVPDSAYASARHAASVVGRSGVGAFTQTALEKKLSGQTVSVSPYISSREEGFQGNAAPEDLETMFQLIHLYATEPRADQNALQTYKQQQRSFLQNRANTPNAVFQDSLVAALYGNHPRVQTPTVEEINALETESLLAFYRERFADASDFTFTLSGNVALDSVKALAQQYLATLPSTERTESVRDVFPDLPEAVVTKTVRAGIGQRAIVLAIYHGPLTYKRENRHALNTLKGVLEIELREELRENRSGVYNVGVSASTQGPPDAGYRFSINFVADPERAEDLLAAARAEIDSVRAGHVDPETVQSVQAQQRRSRETALESNSFWVRALDFTSTTEGEDPLDIYRHDTLVDAITPASVTETATTYLLEDRYVQGILYPEGFGAPDEEEAGSSE